MQPNDYQKLAARTECDEEAAMKRGDNLIATRLSHAAFGLSSEVGEFCDVLKKWLYYGQSLDETNVAEELGDLMWYVALACNALGLSLEEVMEANIRKLRQRYPEKYTDEDALESNRDREAERGVLEDESGTKVGCSGNCPKGHCKREIPIKHIHGASGRLLKEYKGKSSPS